MQLVIFEDELAGNFSPIALTRPVFELLCGHTSLRDRLHAALDVQTWGVLVRDYLQGDYEERFSECRVNSLEQLPDEPSLFVNARCLPDLQKIQKLSISDVGLIDDHAVAFFVPGETVGTLSLKTITNYAQELLLKRTPVDVGGTLLRYPWDLVSANQHQIREDFKSIPANLIEKDLPAHVAFLGDRSQIRIDDSAHLDPYVVIDARHGPVTIENGVIVQAFTRIEGPAFIGRETRLFRANIREGTTIGPVCRIGGELEESIIHGYANSYHDGFLGHSYVCPWVNMGALTTNSDLKNDYSSVRVPVAGQMVDSGTTKVGCMIGDHAKTAIGTFFNTGSSIGVMSMILPAGELQPKHVPSFTRMWHGQMEAISDVEEYLRTARTAMERRGKAMSNAEANIYRFLISATESERNSAIAYQRAKRS